MNDWMPTQKMRVKRNHTYSSGTEDTLEQLWVREPPEDDDYPKRGDCFQWREVPVFHS